MEPKKKEPLGLLADEDAGLEAIGELANCGRFNSETLAWSWPRCGGRAMQSSAAVGGDGADVVGRVRTRDGNGWAE
jgi:hypothetical protein